ncbi:scytalone dehydratase arp1 [Aspergillus saccharolyticus JOP 1030-1]|uniref:NTF2-like protein n=1 Tax=Aspergillus saccharolyticus JOP 1030-1 TaxID=1450539 RepID=A0A318Z550_9EURO|nr:NTF2-like protein [Aspergillus saccharolyticus JOP 1030-1]PYH42441.1 NTF2-like protein [Aspergillus saccharolyticus JOP 1030-1]
MSSSSYHNVLFTWAESIDAKAWSQLQDLFAPTISIDYGAVGGPKASEAPSATFVDWVSDPTRLGNPEIITQHLLGACHWTEPFEDTAGRMRVTVKFQIRAAHWKRTSSTSTSSATGHGTNLMELVMDQQGQWKIVAVTVGMKWLEGDLQAVFSQ